MKLKPRNPLRGSMDPISLTKRLWQFALTSAAMLFMHIYSQTFSSVVRRSTCHTDPQALPERPRKLASRLCMASTAFLFLTIGLAMAKSYHAIWALVVAVLLCAMSGRVLRRTAYGLANAFHRPRDRVEEALRRLLQVIRHGHP